MVAELVGSGLRGHRHHGLAAEDLLQQRRHAISSVRVS
jgi:hypothetical protein